MRRALPIAILALVLTHLGVASAGEKGGVKMPDQLQVAGKTVVLNGLGVREATMFNVDVYVAGLYLEKKTKNADEVISSDQVKVLHLIFVRDVERGDITEAWSSQFKKNGADMAKLKSQIDKLNGWMSEMKEGDAMTFTYVPQKGVNVVVKRAQKGAIAGTDFQRAFFAIWFGKSPPNKGLKSGLLGN
jgi:Chalcone isomerase-like